MIQLVENWGEFKNFNASEFKCSFTGECNMSLMFVRQLQHIRDIYDRPMIITSGFRDQTHPVEIKKNHPGEHSFGLSVDVKCNPYEAVHLIDAALECGISRIGVKQKGSLSGRFIHLGAGDKLLDDRFPPAIWSY